MTTVYWKAAVDGDWSQAADWSSGAVPGSTSDVVIGSLGTYQVTVNQPEAAHSLIVAAGGAYLIDSATLTIGTTITVKAGSFQLLAGGDIVGGTLSVAGTGNFNWAGGTLDGVTYDGTVDLSQGGFLYVTGGFTLKGAGGAGAGTIDDTGVNSAFYAFGGESLDNITLNIGTNSNSYFYVYDPTGATPVLTLGSAFNIVQAGTYVQILGASSHANDGIVNDGSITAALASGYVNIRPANFTNNGSITVSNGDLLYLEPTNLTNGAAGKITVTGSTVTLGGSGTFSNAGAITLGAGTTATIQGTWSNTGTISLASGAALSLAGEFTTAQLTGIANNGGTIHIAGTMANTGATFKVGPGSAEPTVVLDAAGAIVGGVIVDNGSGLQLNSGTLSGVTYQGTLDLSKPDSRVYVNGGLTVTGPGGTGPGTINDTGQSSSLFAYGGETLDNATLNIGSANYYSFFSLTSPDDSLPVLTLGKSFHIVQSGMLASIASDANYANEAIINNGSITAAFFGGQLTIAPLNFTNNGVVRVANGAQIYLYSPNFTNLSGTNLIGGSYEVDASATLFLKTNASITGDQATIILSGAGSVLQGAASIDTSLKSILATGVLEILGGRDWTSTSTLYNSGTLVLGGGTFSSGALSDAAGATLSGFGTVTCVVSDAGTVAASGGVLDFTGSGDTFTGTLSGAGTVAFTAGSDTLSGVTMSAANLTIGAATVALSGAIGLSGTIHSSTGNLLVAAAGASLSGAGALNLTSGSDRLWGVDASATLTNVDDTISGAGALGAGRLTLVNQAAGIIDANASSGLILDTGAATVVNAGLIEATGAGGLTIRSTTVNGSPGGMILAGSGSHVGLQGATLIGGTLKSTGSGVFVTFPGVDGLDGTASAVNNQAVVVLHDNTSLMLRGAIDNSGRFVLNGAAAGASLAVGAAGATLSGGGHIYLDNSPGNSIVGASSAATLTNIDNIITGAGKLGAGSLTLINQAKGFIIGTLTTALVIDTAANTIANAGHILARGAGGVVIQSAVANSGVLEANGGVLTVNGAVSGSGEGVITGGTLDFASSFSQKVVFEGTTGVLELAQSQSYAGTVSGFSKTGGTSLDLRDIAFGGSTKASFSGTATSGTLTVTDGTHTAHITLIGDYRTSTFTAGSDGHGGTIVVDPTAASATTTHHFIAAAAGLGGSAGEAIHVGVARAEHAPILARPHVMIA